MKKLLIVLMVIAMASFLFVGCLPAVTPDIDEDEDEDEDVAVQTDTPFITGMVGITIGATTTQYLSKAEFITGLTVSGVGVAGAIVRFYIDDVQVGVGSTGAGGNFGPIGVTFVTSLTEGVKVAHVTATTPGLAESDASTAYTFIYDKTLPTIASSVADSSAQTITVTFSEAVDTGTTGLAKSALTLTNWEVGGVAITGSNISKVSSTVVKLDLTNCSTAANVPTAFTSYYITVAATVEDLAGNPNTVAIYSAGTTVP